jgi:hypothetical protein
MRELAEIEASPREELFFVTVFEVLWLIIMRLGP